MSSRLLQLAQRLSPFGLGLWALGEGWDRPDELKRALLIFGVLCLAAGAIFEARRLVYRLLPPPWLPDEFWRAFTWLKRRPRFGILLMNVPSMVLTEAGLVDSCRLAPTIWENTLPARDPAAIRYDNATIAMRQKRKGAWRTFVFRPVETGGFLSQVHGPEQRNVIVAFSWTGSPQWPDDAPDFSADYDLTLKGVTAAIQTLRPLTGPLPTVKWRHFHAPARAVATAPATPGWSA
jgi:hypothetical protein